MLFYEYDLEGIPRVKYKKLEIISRSEFRALRNKLELKEINLYVVGGTDLKVIKDSKVSEDSDVIVTADACYRLIDKISSKPKGYLAVSDTEFVAVNAPSILPEVTMLVLMTIIIVAAFIYPRLKKDEPAFNPAMESMQVDGGTGTLSTSGSTTPSSSDMVFVPGYGDCIDTITLENPEDNPVFLRNTLFVIQQSTILSTFDDTIAAQEYMNANKPNIAADADKQCFVNQDTGEELQTAVIWTLSSDGLSILEETVQYVRATNMISPGYEVTIDLRQYLDSGNYDLRIVTGTYDLATGAEGYGTVQDILIQVQ